jgi:hypothetical protein
VKLKDYVNTIETFGQEIKFSKAIRDTKWKKIMIEDMSSATNNQT